MSKAVTPYRYSRSRRAYLVRAAESRPGLPRTLTPEQIAAYEPPIPTAEDRALVVALMARRASLGVAGEGSTE